MVAALLVLVVASVAVDVWSMARTRAVLEQAQVSMIATASVQALGGRPHGPPSGATLERMLAVGAPLGVRWVALVDHEGSPVHEVGARTTTRTPPAPMTPLRDAGRLVARFAPPGLGPPPPGFGPPDRPPGPPPLELLVEIEPLLAQELTHQLARDLAVRGVLAVAVVLAGLALLRLSRRAEELAARSAHERRLSSLGEMSAVLAHELRNPLASLKGNGQLLLEDLPAGPTYDRAQWVVHEAERLEALTESLLSFVRAGDLERAWVDPCAPLRGLRDLSLDLDDAPPVWWLDAVRWGQVVANLTRNAALAGGPTEVRVAGGPDALVLQVRDHGPGLPPNVPVAALFEPFRTTRTHGTGLGLAVVHRIVTQHGGTVTAANAPGGGAVFTVRVPSTGRSPA